MEQLCSSVTSFLDDEADKAGAALKGCKSNCGWKKRKDDLIIAARKKAKKSCSRGEAPDVNDLSKGLDRSTKDRLKYLYDRNSRMFDGTAKLEVVDFNAASSKNTTITGKRAVLGKGGQVADLKISDPAVPKLNSTSESSLSGIKLSGDTSNPASTKQSATLLASASSAKTSANTVFVSSAKSPAATVVSAAENQPPAKSQSASFADENYNQACLQALKLKCGCSWEGVCSGDALKCFEKDKETCRIGAGCSPGQVLNAKGDCVAPCPDGKTAPDLEGNCPCGKLTYDPKASCCSTDGKLSPGQVPDGKGGCGCPPGQVLSGWGIFSPKKCVPACGGKKYNPDKQCCVNGIIVGKCGQKTKYDGAFEDVYNNRDTIIATAKKYNIPETVLAGVVFTERSSTFYETLTDPMALYVRSNPSFGLTQVSVGIAYMMDNPGLIPTNYSKMTFKERKNYLIDLAKNIPMDLKKAYKHALEADPKTSINYSARYLKFLQDQRGVSYPSDSLWVGDYSRGLTTTTTELSRLGKIYDQNKEELYPIIRPEEYPECGCSKP